MRGGRDDERVSTGLIIQWDPSTRISRSRPDGFTVKYTKVDGVGVDDTKNSPDPPKTKVLGRSKNRG